MKGINYMKNGKDPIALEDHEYPDWLWTLLDKNNDQDLSSKSFRRKLNIQRIKENNLKKNF